MTTTVPSAGVAVSVSKVSKIYRKGGEDIPVLTGVDLEIAAGERLSIIGPSGCGKSTFLHLLGMLDRPTSGAILLGGRDVTRLPETERDTLRNRSVGFVFQAHHLLPEHTAISNVMIPARLAGATVSDARIRAGVLLEAVGLSHRLEHRPGELSGGEQQRVAIARSLVMTPGLILADEPTGNLDPRTAGGVFDTMMDIVAQLGSTLIVVTHSHELAARFGRRLALDLGVFREAT